MKPLLNFATARWPKLGVIGEFATYGAFPDDTRDNGCNTPASIQPDNVQVTNKLWHTVAGLHPGDPLKRLHQLYPAATKHADGWWIQKGHSNVGTPHDFGVIVASVSGSLVNSIELNIGAEGDQRGGKPSAPTYARERWAGGLSHTDACAGCTAPSTARSNSVRIVSRSTASRSPRVNVATIASAS